jgi:hypothetical protein
LLVPDRQVRDFIAPTRLVPRQTSSDMSPDLCPAPAHRRPASKTRCGTNRSAAPENATSGRQMIASNADAVGRHEWQRGEKQASPLPESGRTLQQDGETISGRRAYEHQTSYHAPADSARWDHRSSSRDQGPAATAVLRTTTRYRKPRRDRAARSRERRAR